MSPIIVILKFSLHVQSINSFIYQGHMSWATQRCTQVQIGQAWNVAVFALGDERAI